MLPAESKCHAITGCTGLIIFLCCITCWNASAAEQSPQAEESAEIKITESIPVLLQPRRKAVLSAEVSVRLTKIHKEMGESFKKDDILLECDATVFEARKKKAKADLETAAAALAAATRLYKSKSRSLLELMKAKNDEAVARSNLAVAEHELNSCTVKAPYDGRVVKVMADEHELLQRGEELISLVDDRVLRARFLVPANFFQSLKKKFRVLIKIPGVERDISGTITHISASIDSASNTFEVYAEVDNRESILRGGMIGALKTILPPADAAK
ncbi:MAG: efflux RND transporter periplasmic adaptor subunit [Planctomycetota bacterium]|jgi:RND family efflux transporter MFP subunit